MKESIQEKNERYSRQLMLPEISEEGQKKLEKSHVAVIGAGGLGSPILLYLAAAGIGHIGIIDNDIISLSNLQRQILYTTQDLNFPKANKAKKKLDALNPNIKLEAYNQRLTQDNIEQILKKYAVIVDATDNYQTRILLDQYCSQQKKALIHGSVMGFTGQISIFHKLGAGGYTTLFPDIAKKDDTQVTPILGATAGALGAIEAMEVIKLCLNIGSPLVNKLLRIDLLYNDYQIFQI